MKLRLGKDSRLYLVFWLFLSLVILELVVWFTDIPFSGYLSQSFLTPFWYYLSFSGGEYGTAILLVIVGILLSARKKSWMLKLKQFILSVVGFGVMLGALGLLNEFALKRTFQVIRPHIYHFHEIGVMHQSPEYFYLLERKERVEFLIHLIENENDKLTGYHPLILNHWAHVVGYSFPSGHSQNAFLLGTLLAWLWLLHSNRRGYWLCGLPILWAIVVAVSRVAIGVHTPLDVSIGAINGALVAAIVIIVFHFRERQPRVVTELIDP